MPRDIVIPVGDTEFVVGDDETHESFLSVAAALEGDESRIRKRLSDGVALSKNERDFLTGKLKRVRHRPSRKATRDLDWKIALIVRYCEKLARGTESAVATARDAFKISRTRVFNAIRAVESDPGSKLLLEETMRDESFSEDGLQKIIDGIKYRAETSITRHNR